MNKSRQLRMIVAMVLISGTAHARKSDDAQQAGRAVGGSNKECVLSKASNGQVITIHGKAVQEPHDLGFEISGCRETVLLTYAGDQDNQVSGHELRRDENLARFQKYTTSTLRYPSREPAQLFNVMDPTLPRFLGVCLYSGSR